MTSAAGPAAAFRTASLQANIAALDKCPTSSSCAAAAKPLLAPNATRANDTKAEPLDETMDADITAAGNATGTVGDLATAANATGSLEAMDNSAALDAVNATTALEALNTTTATDAVNSTGAKGGQASRAADVAPAAAKSAETSKPKSAAASSSPMGLFAAVCAVAAVGVLVL